VSISEAMVIRKKLLIALDQDARQQAEGSAGEAMTAKAAAMASQPASPGRQNTSSTAAVQSATPAATMAMAAVLAAIRVCCRQPANTSRLPKASGLRMAATRRTR
jgi:hypothetical protein